VLLVVPPMTGPAVDRRDGRRHRGSSRPAASILRCCCVKSADNQSCITQPQLGRACRRLSGSARRSNERHADITRLSQTVERVFREPGKLWNQLVPNATARQFTPRALFFRDFHFQRMPRGAWQQAGLSSRSRRRDRETMASILNSDNPDLFRVFPQRGPCGRFDPVPRVWADMPPSRRTTQSNIFERRCARKMGCRRRVDQFARLYLWLPGMSHLPSAVRVRMASTMLAALGRLGPSMARRLNRCWLRRSTTKMTTRSFLQFCRP